MQKKLVQKKNTEILLHLSLSENIGPATVFKILHRLLLDSNSDLKSQDSSSHDPSSHDLLNPDWADIFKKGQVLNLSALYDCSLSDFTHKFGLSVNCAQQIYDGLADSQVLEKELELAEKNDVKIVDILSPEYPEYLRQIHHPPIVLYISGAMFDQTAKHFAVVGARKADSYAAHVIESIVPMLVANDWVIVSGGANGADTMAHQTTLKASGKTVVVLGSGLLSPYPENNISLFKAVVKNGGTLVSPFPLRRQPDRSTFPARNRIISGLSMGCLVVQAASKSGALITAHCALDQGRLVFAVPGRIDDMLSAGCNELIKQGAKLVCGSNDILEEFGQALPAGKFRPAVVVEAQMDITGKNCDHCDDIVLCKLDRTSTMDELLIATGLDFTQLQDRLFNLQLEGRVKQNFTGAWERVGR